MGTLVWGVSTASDANAEYVVMRDDRVSRAPSGIGEVALGALPVAGTTGMAAVDRFARVRAGERVLVRGAAGGVGSAVVQIAHARGGVVTALASPVDGDAVVALGAAEVLDYRSVAPQELGAFDVIIDTVGSDLGHFRRRLAPGGRFVTITIDFAHPVRGILTVLASTVHGGQRIRQLVRVPHTADMAALTDAVEAGSLVPVIDSVYPLAEVAAAHTRAEQHGTVGKVVLGIGGATAE